MTSAHDGNPTAAARAVRVFVALKMTAEVAQALAELAAPLRKFGIRPIAPEDIHLTLVPPWNESSTADAIAKLHPVAAQHLGFTLSFRHLGYGPNAKRPHLLWVDCAGSELTELHDALLLTFGQKEERAFLPHVTLARLRASGTRIARKCPIDRDIALTQTIVSVELMQSPPPGEHGYRVLASAPLAPPA